MRQALKFLHTIASAGLIGALAVYMVVLARAPQDSAQQVADMRRIVSLICDVVIIPSLGIALVSGLLSMMAHRPFQQMRWVWLKALLGLSLFEATLAITQTKATDAATIARQIASGAAPAQALAETLANEWTALGAIAALCLAQAGLGVWRPRLVWPVAR